jgi:hypothetical protein
MTSMALAGGGSIPTSLILEGNGQPVALTPLSLTGSGLFSGTSFGGHALCGQLRRHTLGPI